MSSVERITVSLPSEMVADLQGLVETGDYASAGDVVREALADWKLKQRTGLDRLAALKADIAVGVADYEAGRTSEFNLADIIARGRQLSGRRLASD